VRGGGAQTPFSITWAHKYMHTHHPGTHTQHDTHTGAHTHVCAYTHTQHNTHTHNAHTHTCTHTHTKHICTHWYNRPVILVHQWSPRTPEREDKPAVRYAGTIVWVMDQSVPSAPVMQCCDYWGVLSSNILWVCTWRKTLLQKISNNSHLKVIGFILFLLAKVFHLYIFCSQTWSVSAVSFRSPSPHGGTINFPWLRIHAT